MSERRFIREEVEEIRREVGEGIAINALSGGVDSSTVTVLAHRALGRQLKTVFVDNALMREGEPERVLSVFAKMKIPVERIDARRITAIPGVNRCVYDLTPKPPATVEYV